MNFSLQNKRISNKLRVLTIKNPTVDSVTLTVFVKAGGRYEQLQKSGLSHFVEHTIFKGTQRRPTAKQIALEIEGVGGVQNAATGHEYTYYYIKIPKEKAALAFDILSDILFHSKFEADQVELERRVILEEINVYNDSPMDKVSDYLFNIMWPEQPLGKDLTGTKEEFLGLKREDIVSYVETFYHPNNMLLVVAGNFDEKEVDSLTKEYFGKEKEIVVPSSKPVVEKQQKPVMQFFQKKTDQTHFIFGFRSLPLNHPKRFIMDLLITVLGKGMSSRLFEELREKNGLCYYVYSDKESFADTGVMMIQAGVDNERFMQAISLTVKELVKIKNELIPQHELSKAKEYLKGKMKLSLETTDSQGHFFGLQELLLGKVLTPEEIYSKIDAITSEEIQQLATEVFVPEKANLAIIGPQKNGSAKNKKEIFLMLMELA